MVMRSESDHTSEDTGMLAGEPSMILTVPHRASSVPDRTLADLLAEVILRGKSPQTRKAYRADLDDFLVWLLGHSVGLPADPEILRADPQAAIAINAGLSTVQRVTEGDINAYLRHLTAD